MAALPSRMTMSDCGSSEGGLKVMERPVGNSPGPDSMVKVTGGELEMGLPPASSTATRSWQSSVASVPWMVVLSAVRERVAGTPSAGHSGGGCGDIGCGTSTRSAWGCREIIDEAHAAEVAEDGAVIECAPEALAAAPGVLGRSDVEFLRDIEAAVNVGPGVAAVGDVAAVLGDHVGDARVLESLEPRAIAIVAGDVADLVNIAALAAADGGGSGRVELMGLGDKLGEEALDLVGILVEEDFVAHAPRDDGGVVAEYPDFIAKGVEGVLLEGALVVGIGRVTVGGPIAVRTAAHAPETILRPEENAEAVASIGEGGVVGIV